MSKKSFVEDILVKDPCTESWDEMAGNDVVRFCSHCSKNVNNISEMTPRQAAKIVRRGGGNICVRYRKEPDTGLPVFAATINRIARSTGVTAGVLGVSLLLAEGVAAQVDTAAAVQTEQAFKPGSGPAKLSGVVTDPNDAVIPFALVSITNQATSEYRTANANADGVYEFADLPAGNYTVKVEAGGFEFREMSGVSVSEGTAVRRDARLDLPKIAEAVQVSGGKIDDYGSVGGVMVSIEARNALVQAVLNGDLEEVKARVAMHAKVNVKDKAYDGITPLHAAVESGNLEIAQFLLSHGAKINIRDFQKRTPLMMLDDDATPEMFQLLATYGAKMKLVDSEGNTPLHHLAGYDGRGEIVRQLVSYGVNVNALNKEGKTALMIAAENESESNIEALVQSGADPNLAGKGAKTAWQLADDAKVRSLLETYGAVAVEN